MRRACEIKSIDINDDENSRLGEEVNDPSVSKKQKLDKKKKTAKSEEAHLCFLANNHRASHFMPTVPSDLSLAIFDEINQITKTLNVHRVILNRCPHFHQLLLLATDSPIQEISLDQYRFSVYLPYVQYLYTSHLEVSNDLVFEVYQLVSDFDPANEQLLVTLGNTRKQIDLAQLVHLYMFYHTHGGTLYPAYDELKMRKFFEDYISVTIRVSEFDWVLEKASGTPLATRIAQCQGMSTDSMWLKVEEELYSTHNLSYWPILEKLSDAMLAQIGKFYVFGGGQSLLVLTKEDRVYALGANQHGQLGVGHRNEVTVPEEVGELSGKRLTFLANGSGFVMALTASGDLYGFGSNQYGQVGVGSVVDQAKPTLIKKGVQMVRCGEYHTIALDIDHDVWHWGKALDRPSEWGLRVGNLEPVKMGKSFKSRANCIVHVACSSNFSMMASKSSVMLWGEFGNQTHHVHYPEPTVVDPILWTFPPVPFKAEIIAGFGDYFIAIDSDGKGYFSSYRKSFVYEDLSGCCEQLIDLFWPLTAKFAVFVGKSGQLYTLHMKDYNAVSTVWHRSLPDVYAMEGFVDTPTLTHLPPFLLSAHWIKRDLSFNTVDQSGQSDTFEFATGNGDRLYLDLSVVKQRAPCLFKLLTDYQSDNTVTIMDPSVSHGAYEQYFRYVHTGTWRELSHRDLGTVFELYTLSELYQDSALTERCEEFISRTLVAEMEGWTLAKRAWLTSHPEDVKLHFGLLATKYGHLIRFNSCYYLYRNHSFLRDALIPWFAQREDRLNSNDLDVDLTKEIRKRIGWFRKASN